MCVANQSKLLSKAWTWVSILHIASVTDLKISGSSRSLQHWKGGKKIKFLQNLEKKNRRSWFEYQFLCYGFQLNQSYPLGYPSTTIYRLMKTCCYMYVRHVSINKQEFFLIAYFSPGPQTTRYSVIHFKKAKYSSVPLNCNFINILAAVSFFLWISFNFYSPFKSFHDLLTD